MKYLSSVFLLASFGLALTAKAQDSVQRALRSQHKALVQEILDKQATAAFAQRATGMRQRLVLRTGKDATSAQPDSVLYTYSTPARGANHNPAVIESYFGAGQVNEFLIQDRYRALPPFILCDSMYSRNRNTGDILSSRYLYGASNELTQLLNYLKRPFPYSRDTVSRFLLHYDGAGNCIKAEYFEDTSKYLSPRLQPYNIQFYRYDAAGRCTFDSVQYLPASINGQWTNRKNVHSYDAAGRMWQTLNYYSSYPGNPTELRSRTQHHYNADGLLTLLTSDVYDAATGSWHLLDLDSFSYSGNSPCYTYHFSAGYNDFLGVYEPVGLEVGRLNASGTWDTLTTSTYDRNPGQFLAYQRYVFHYNSHGNYQQLDAYYKSTSDSFTAAPNYTWQFLYEEYTPSAGMTSVAGSKGLYRSYPNPSTTSFILERPDAVTADTYLLTDALGRVVLRGTMPAGVTRQNVATDRQAPGVYFLTVHPEAAPPQLLRLVLQ